MRRARSVVDPQFGHFTTAHGPEPEVPPSGFLISVSFFSISLLTISISGIFDILSAALRCDAAGLFSPGNGKGLSFLSAEVIVSQRS